MSSVNGFTKEAWVEKRMAEGFTKEYAENEYTQTIDPIVKKAQEQEPLTRGDMMVLLHGAFLNNPDRKKVYSPDFSLSEEYLKLKAEAEALVGTIPYDTVKANELSDRMLHIQIEGTFTDEDRQAEIDKTLEMPIKQILMERKKYEKIIADCEEKIDNFDLTAVQAEADALAEKWEKTIQSKSGIYRKEAEAQYQKALDKLEHEKITKPLNDLKIQRWEAKEHYFIYEARVSYYVLANKELIKEEMVRAKREEIRASLVDLAEYIENEDEEV